MGASSAAPPVSIGRIPCPLAMCARVKKNPLQEERVLGLLPNRPWRMSRIPEAQ